MLAARNSLRAARVRQGACHAAPSWRATAASTARPGRRSRTCNRACLCGACKVAQTSCSSSCTCICSKFVQHVLTRSCGCSSITQPSLLGSRMMGAGVSAALALTMMLSPLPASAISLADVERDDFGFVDANKDGIISQDELVKFSEQVATDLDMEAPPVQQISFLTRLFDLNGDGKLSSEEMLVSLALDRGVSDDAVDENVYKAFDANGDGLVDMKEWTSTLGDMGKGGREVQEFIFRRVERMSGLSGDGTGKLELDSFVPAFNQLRTAVMGY